MTRVPPMICKPHRVPECLQCMKGKKMAWKCEHGLTTAECFVCASPKYGLYPKHRPTTPIGWSDTDWLRHLESCPPIGYAVRDTLYGTSKAGVLRFCSSDEAGAFAVYASPRPTQTEPSPSTPPQVQVPLTEFKRMQIIGDEFPLALVEPIVIAKVDSVCRAIEKAHGIGA